MVQALQQKHLTTHFTHCIRMSQYSFSKHSCWSKLTIDIVSESDPTHLVQDCFLLCDTFEQRYSRFIEGNRLRQLNQTQEIPVELDNEANMLVTAMLDIAQKTQGVFDPTIIRTLESYGYDKDYSFEQKDAGWPVGYHNIEHTSNRLTLHNNVKIEFWSIGKWYLVDVISWKLSDAWYDHFLVDFWGDMYGRGGYKVGLENPFDLEQVIGTITIDGFAVAASNGKKRKVKQFHHLLDAHSGKPVDDIAGVYIAAKSCMMADLYSTAVFVSGKENGLQLLAETEEITGLIVFADGSYRKKEGYAGELFG